MHSDYAHGIVTAVGYYAMDMITVHSTQLLYDFDTKYTTTAVGGGATIAVAVVILVT